MTSTPFHCFEAQTARSDAAEHLQRIRVLIAAYRSWGGSVHANELPALPRTNAEGGSSQLIRWLLSGEIISIRVRACWHVPLFQFCRGGPAVRPSVARVVDELRDRRDGMAVAEWFVRPNAWLEARWPLALLDRDHDAVLRAARADSVG